MVLACVRVLLPGASLTTVMWVRCLVRIPSRSPLLIWINRWLATCDRVPGRYLFGRAPSTCETLHAPIFAKYYPVDAVAVLLRDMRVFHGGTPNLLNEIHHAV